MDRNDINIAIGRNLRRWRLMAGMSQRVAACHLGISTRQLQRYESGTSGLSCDRLLTLATLLGCNADELCG